MPKRPASHQLESTSRIALARRLPPSWVLRDESPDYGVDASLEVFAPGGAATGLRCFVQLKATAKAANRPSVRLRLETYRYLRSLDLPVLIALYEGDRDRVLVRWLHEFDPFYERVGKKDIAFLLTDEHAWSDDTPARLEADLRALRLLRKGTLPLPVPVRITLASERVAGVGSARLRLALRKELQALGRTFRETSDTGVLAIHADTDRIVVTVRGYKSVTWHLTAEDTLEPATCAREILVLASVAIGMCGDHTLASTLAGRYAGRSRLMRIPQFVMGVVNSVLLARQRPLLVRIARELLDEEECRSTADALLALAMIPDAEDGDPPNELETALRAWIADEANRGENAIVGTAHYNLAKLLSRAGRTREALRHFRLAAQVHPAYRQRDYYHNDLGGLLFNAGFYRAAAGSYSEAVRLGGSPEWTALLADALIFAGDFEAARDTLDLYLQREPGPGSGWFLKRSALNVILSMDRPSKGRSRTEARRLLEAELGNNLETALRALAADPLCTSAWLRLYGTDGAVGEEFRGLRETGIAVAAILVHDAPELWVEAFLRSAKITEEGAPDLAFAFAALDAVGDQFFEELLMRAELAPDVDIDAILTLIEALRHEHQQVSKPQTFDLRFVGDGPEYEVVTLGLDALPEEAPADISGNR